MKTGSIALLCLAASFLLSLDASIALSQDSFSIYIDRSPKQGHIPAARTTPPAPAGSRTPAPPRAASGSSPEGPAAPDNVERQLPAPLSEEAAPGAVPPAVLRQPRGLTDHPIAVLILADKSQSMGENGGLAVLPEALKEVAASFYDNDSFGVVAFDSLPFVISHLRPAADMPDNLEDLVRRLAPSGKADLKQALANAGAQFEKSRIPKKHLILITDGQPASDFIPAGPSLEVLAASGISISIAGIGGQPDQDVLRRLAERSGGRFYQVQPQEDLSKVLLRDISTKRPVSQIGI